MTESAIATVDPREALIAYLQPYGVSAIQSALYGLLGTTWEYVPETYEIGFWTPEYCEDCATWHNHHHAIGFRIENRKLWATFHNFEDEDVTSDWSEEVASVAEIAALERKMLREAMDAQIAYYEHVKETGDDPLSEFGPAPWLNQSRAERCDESIASCRGVLARLAEQEEAGEDALGISVEQAEED